MAKKKPTPLLDELAKNSDNHEFLMQMMDKFLSNEGGIVDIAWKEIDRKDKAKQREAEKKRAKDLEIRITADASSNRTYLISIKNIGISPYKNFSITYRDILLNADSFGIDTTYVPAECEYIKAEKIFVKDLAPGETVSFLREGCDTHRKYERESKRVVRLEFADKNPITQATDVIWAYAVIDLPKAKKRRTEKFYA